MPTARKATSTGNTTQVTSPDRPDTPPDTPAAQLHDPFEFAKQILNALKFIQTPESKEASSTVGFSGPQVEQSATASPKVARGSKLEAKKVHEVWNSKVYEYKVVESIPTVELTELDAHVFVIRTRIDKTTLKPVVFIDIKSTDLQNALRVVLKDIKWMSLSGDKPVVEQSLLFHYLPELELHRANAAADPKYDPESFKALELLIIVANMLHFGCYSQARIPQLCRDT